MSDETGPEEAIPAEAAPDPGAEREREEADREGIAEDNRLERAIGHTNEA